MILPSKELLSAVLGVTQVTDLKIRDNKLFYTSYNNPSISNWKAINVHELAHKCKEWAISKGYDVLSGGLEAGLYSCYIDYAAKRYTLLMTPLYHTFEDTEFEAVIQACEWVRSNR
jgi:hypothetical protein